MARQSCSIFRNFVVDYPLVIPEAAIKRFLGKRYSENTKQSKATLLKSHFGMGVLL